MAQDEKRADEALTDDEATLLKKRARRRLIGAAALALLAAVVLPMVMDHQPAPPLKDIQVRIPAPDEGTTQRLSPSVDQKPAAIKTSPAPVAAAQPAAEAPPATPPESLAAAGKTEAKAPASPTKPETSPPAKEKEAARAEAALAGKSDAAAWEVQLGAYQEAGRVKLLTGKLKELGLPFYTEKVGTPNGPRTRVRAGPFPTQEAAEKARVRIKIIGVDGPVARKS